MKRKSSVIFVMTLVIIGIISFIGSRKNIKSDNSINDEHVLLEEETTPEETLKIELEYTKETVDSETLAVMGPNSETTERPTEAPTEEPTEAPTVAPTEAPTEPPTMPPTEAPTMPPTEAPTMPPTEAPTNPPVVQNWKYVIVGDSRTVGMQQEAVRLNIAGGRTFICEVGIGYNYLQANLPVIQSLCDSSTILVIALGINDMGNLEKYIALMNSMANWDCHIYFSLVAPVNEAKELAARGSCTITNAAINNFNVNMLQRLDKRIGIIDMYTYVNNVILDNSMTSVDGIHFTAAMYLNTYQFLVASLP